MSKESEDLALEVHNLTVSYNRKPVLWDIDFSLPQGQLIGIVGPNGSGKTTLLKTIMGLLEPDSGYVELKGKPLKEVREQVSYVPQRESVDWDFPADVMDVVKMGRYRKGNILKRLSKDDKRTDYPGKEIAIKTQYAWDQQFNTKINVVYGNEWNAGNLSYHLKSRPIWDGIVEREKLDQLKDYMCLDNVCVGSK